jgi:ABC-type uncharacterized transport system ATPase subunit
MGKGVKSMKKVNVNGVQYLGTLTDKDGTVTLSDAFAVNDGMNKDVFAQYLKAQNNGSLASIEFSGQGIAYSVSNLNDVEQMELDMAILAMKHAKKIAIPELENDSFDNILGK